MADHEDAQIQRLRDQLAELEISQRALMAYVLGVVDYVQTLPGFKSEQLGASIDKRKQQLRDVIIDQAVTSKIDRFIQDLWNKTDDKKH